MNGLPVELPTGAMVRVAGPGQAGAGFFASADGLIVTCAHLLPGCPRGTIVRVEPHVSGEPRPAEVVLIQDPPDIAVLRLTGTVPPDAVALQLGESPQTLPRPGLRTFGYPRVRLKAGLPGDLVYIGPADDEDAGYEQLVLRSDVATLGYSGAPIWDPELGAVAGMIKSIVIDDPGHRQGSIAFGVPSEVIRDLCPELQFPGGCPYRGLDPFTEEHVDFYYGRERATSQLLASLGAGNFVPVVAVSGSGKSSLLQAGLAKGLRDQPVAGLAQRIRCYQRVGSRPHAELLHSLAQHGVRLPLELAAAPPGELAEAIRGAVPASGLIVVADQFERLYTDCKDAAERKRFVELLLLLAADAVKVAIGLRADFYHLALADLGERLAAGQVALAPMTDQDLTRAIGVPAGKVLRSFQPGLTRQLIADVRGSPGDLPLLQFALTALWERDGAGGVLTEETYRDLGVVLSDGTRLPGVQGALIDRAEHLWRDLGRAEQERLKRVLFGLIAEQPAGAGAASLETAPRDLGRPALLAQWSDDDQRLMHQLVDARLLTVGSDPDGQPTVEVSHEVLLRAWPRLRAWLNEDREFVQWRARDLAPNLELWLAGNTRRQRRQVLLRRPLLNTALQWLNDYPDRLTGPPADYIRASSWRRDCRRWLVLGATAVLVAGSAAAAFFFYSLQRTAVQQRDQAIYAQVRAEAVEFGTSDIPLAAQLTLAAYRLQPTPGLATSLLNTGNMPLSFPLTGSGGSAVRAVAFSPDGHILAGGSSDGTVRLWDVTDPAHPQLLSQLPVSSSGRALAFSPVGRTLVGGNGDGTVQLWDVTDPAHPRQLSQLPASGGSTVSSVVFSTDGHTLASAYPGMVRLWDVADPAKPRLLGQRLTIGSGGVDEVAFSPDGHTLAGAYYRDTFGLWDVADPVQPRLLSQPSTSDSNGSVYAMAFNPDGRTVASGNTDGRLQLWDVNRPARPQLLGQPPASGSGGVDAVAFSPDGRILVSGNIDGTCGLWDVADPAHPRQLGQPLTAGRSGAVDSVAFSPDGRMLASGTTDGTLRLWALPLTALITPSGAVDAVAFSPDGRTIASGNDDGAGVLWDVANQVHPRLLGPSLTTSRGSAVRAVAFSSHGHMLASGNDDGTIRLWAVTSPADPQPLGQPLTTGSSGGVDAVAFSSDSGILAATTLVGPVWLWDVTDPKHPQPLGQPLPGSGGGVDAVAFSPNGHILAAAYFDGAIRLWDVTHPAHPQPLGQPLSSSGVDAVAFSPAGDTLAAGNLGGTIQLWDVTSPADPQPLGQPLASISSGDVNVLAFSPVGHTLASGNEGGAVELWDVADPAQPQPLGQLMTGSSVDAVTFSADGRSLASGSDDGITRLWTMNVDDVIKRICLTAGGLTHQQWHDYIPHLPYQRLCSSSGDPAPRAAPLTAR